MATGSNRVTEIAVEAAAKASWVRRYAGKYPEWEEAVTDANWTSAVEAIRLDVRDILEAATPHLLNEVSIKVSPLRGRTSDSLIQDTSLRTYGKDFRIKGKNTPKAAMGNMRTHLYIDSDKPVWTTVDKGDLEVILGYVKALEAEPAQVLEDFADFLLKPQSEGLDEYTLTELALEARHKASKLRNE